MNAFLSFLHKSLIQIAVSSTYGGQVSSLQSSLDSAFATAIADF